MEFLVITSKLIPTVPKAKEVLIVRTCSSFTKWEMQDFLFEHCPVEFSTVMAVSYSVYPPLWRMWLLNPSNMAGVTEKLNAKFYVALINLNGHTGLVPILLHSATPNPPVPIALHSDYPLIRRKLELVLIILRTEI